MAVRLAAGLAVVLLAGRAAAAAEPPAPAPAPAPASEERRQKPLFEVVIDHPFPEPRKAFEEVLRLVSESYYTETDEKSLYWGAVEGVLARLSPEENRKLATIWQPEQYERINDTLHGVQESIGIRSSYTQADGSLTVTEVIAGGPSETLLQVCDRIVRIDGLPLKGLPVQGIDGMLKGEAGTKVSLKVVRDVAVFDLVVTRSRVKVAVLDELELPGRVRYVSLTSFPEGVSDDLKKALAGLSAAAACAGLIVDLRDNGGGVFGEGLKCAEQFVAKGQSLMRLVEHGGAVKNYVSANETPFVRPLVVLVNANSASASEIMVTALRDSAGAAVVGTRSFGKATMERIFTLENQYRVKFTTAALFSPKGRSWQKSGVEPDYPVDQDVATCGKTRKLPAAQRLAADHQLRVAHQLLQRAAVTP